MSTWSETRLVAGREVDEKLHSKPFLYSILFFLVIVIASIALPPLLTDDGPETYDVAVVGASAQQLVEAVPEVDVDLTAVPQPDTAAADRAVREEDVEAAVLLDGDGLRLVGLTEVPNDLREALLSTAQLSALGDALATGGAAPAEVTRLLSPPQAGEVLLDDRGVDAQTIALLGIAFAFVFFFVVYTFGFAIAQSVVQEKESRVVELLVSAVPVQTLLAGKVVGNSVLALLQIVLLAGVALAGAAVTGQGELVGVLAANSPWFVLFFFLGFVMLSCLWAASGALASRTEDLQSTTTPLQLLVLLPFFAAFYVTDGVGRVVLSFLPISAPIVMPQRLLAQDAALWEAGLSALLVLLTAVAFIGVGARLYRSSLLRTRGKSSLSQAWSGTTGTPV